MNPYESPREKCRDFVADEMSAAERLKWKEELISWGYCALLLMIMGGVGIVQFYFR